MRSIYRLRVTLLGIEPPIWRRLHVPSDLTLGGLHQVMQLAMGWRHREEHIFKIGSWRAGQPKQDVFWREEEDSNANISDLVTMQGPPLRYLCDLEIGWEHELHLERIDLENHKIHYPCCSDGARACPPEPCSSLAQYQEFQWAITQVEHPLHHRAKKLYGEEFDPEHFDLEIVNIRFQDANDEDWYEGELPFFREDENGVLAVAQITYDANQRPDPGIWLQLEQADQISAIEHYHVREKIRRRTASLQAHAVLHMAVESHLAQDEPAQTRVALRKLIESGMSRHDAVHTIGSVFSEHLGRALQNDFFDHDAYAADLEGITSQPTSARTASRVLAAIKKHQS